MKKVLAGLLILSLSLFILIICIENSAYNKNYYMNSYEDNNIGKQTGKSRMELSRITDDLISYLKGQGGEDLLGAHFNEKEILHMVDVQALFKLARTIKIFAVIIILITILYLTIEKEYLFIAKTLYYGPFINYFIFALLGLLAAIDFNKYFTYFHLIFFTNDLWILDPNKDLMIQMLPENFFMGMAKNIMLSFFLYLAIIQLMAYFYLRRRRISNEKDSRNT